MSVTIVKPVQAYVQEYWEINSICILTGDLVERRSWSAQILQEGEVQHATCLTADK